MPNDFFVDIVSSNNFLATILNQLFAFVRNNETVDLALRNRMEKFQVTQSLNWYFRFDFFNRENVSKMDYKIGPKLPQNYFKIFFSPKMFPKWTTKLAQNWPKIIFRFLVDLQR